MISKSNYKIKKKCLIKQPLGIGDVLYCLKIAFHYKELGYEVVWPLKSELMFMSDYIEGINFCDESKDFPYKHHYVKHNTSFSNDDLIYVCIQMTGGPGVMTNKYSIANLGDEDWGSYIKFNRRLDKEYKLQNYLQIGTEPYILVNRNYYPWKTGKDMVGQFRVDSDIKQINMSRIEGFNVFDWIGVMEGAEEIWTMDTCLVIMASALRLEGKKLKMFIRGNDPRTLNTVVDKNWDIKLLKWSL